MGADTSAQRFHEPPSSKIRVVCATREDREGFLTRTHAGRSFALLRSPFLELQLKERNSDGLPAVYNQAIETARTDPALLVFVHDDVMFCDFFWAEQLFFALTHFHVVGVAGNKRRMPRQPSWLLVDDKQTWDRAEHLSGAVGVGDGYPPKVMAYYGASRQEVKLLDGLLLAVHSQTLIDNDIRFDERFTFHLYDMDFCRQVESRGLKMGTWPIPLVHGSAGNYDTPAWTAAYESYIAKWGD